MNKIYQVLEVVRDKCLVEREGEPISAMISVNDMIDEVNATLRQYRIENGSRYHPGFDDIEEFYYQPE
jgi:hypothetical protein